MNRADVETLWVNAWNDLYEIIGTREDFPCVLPDHTLLTPEGCRGWLQRSVYEGCDVRVSRGWHEGRPAVVVSRQPRKVG